MMRPARTVQRSPKHGPEIVRADRTGWSARRISVAVLRGSRDAWRRLRAWRRISFTSGGLAFTLGTMAVGFAAMNTGNNLLYLLLGSMLGFITVSGWLSEQAIRGLNIERRHLRAVTVGNDFRLVYEVTNTKTRLPSLAVEISEEGLPEKAFLTHVAPSGHTATRSVNNFVRRGVYPLDTLTLSTGFPFGMFRKERDLKIPGEVIVWPARIGRCEIRRRGQDACHGWGRPRVARRGRVANTDRFADIAWGTTRAISTGSPPRASVSR